jgi:hypothetical protein
VFLAAAQHGNLHFLDYILEQGEFVNAELLTVALNYAGMLDRLETAQWLRQRGAQWPAVLGESDTPAAGLWSCEALVWATAEGCISPEIDELAADDDGAGHEI